MRKILNYLFMKNKKIVLCALIGTGVLIAITILVKKESKKDRRGSDAACEHWDEIPMITKSQMESSKSYNNKLTIA